MTPHDAGPPILTERHPQSVDAERVPLDVAHIIRKRWSDYVSIDRDFDEGGWRMTPRDHVGYLPVTPEFGIRIQPKTPLANILGMLEVAWGVKIQTFDGLARCVSLEDFFDRLAAILTERIQQRIRRGLHRSYVHNEDSLAYVRGRIVIREMLRPSAAVRIHCAFEEHTGDIEDNQLLLWTLFIIARSGLCRPETARLVQAAYRALHNAASLERFDAETCLKRLYHRLNDDYEVLHVLCWFFLTNSGPNIAPGERGMVPFVVNMPDLFEKYVAKRLERDLPARYFVKEQEPLTITKGVVHYRMDIVIYDNVTRFPICVLDTKYKEADTPKNDDINQLVAYATALGCEDGILVYPTKRMPRDTHKVGNKRVSTMSYPLDGDLEQDGHSFAVELEKILVAAVSRLSGSNIVAGMK